MLRLKLKSCREKSGISQKKLAQKIGVDESTIIRWEKQRSKPNMKYLPLLCKALGVQPGDLLTVKEGTTE